MLYVLACYMDYGSGADRSLLGPAVRCVDPELVALSGLYKDMTQRRFHAKAKEREEKRQKEICVFSFAYLASLRETASNRVLQCDRTVQAQLSRASIAFMPDSPNNSDTSRYQFTT